LAVRLACHDCPMIQREGSERDGGAPRPPLVSPIEPPPSRWAMPNNAPIDDSDIVALGADLEPGTLLAAYRQGLFPMPYDKRRIAWFSPARRGIIPLDGLRVSRSLRRSMSRYEVRTDTRFRAVMEACADPARKGGWINRDFVDAYARLHELGWAHSVETYDDSGRLVGGLYGVRIERLFAGESMFHRATDASKVALLGLVELLDDDGLLDVQWVTPHLASLGAVGIPAPDYQARLAAALTRPLPPVFG
jgi:leucyl/phenylalanyl-tRNA--protein transferase